MGKDVLIVNNVTPLLISMGAVIIIGGLFYLFIWPKIDRQIITKRRRRKAHLRYVRAIILELKYKLINLALSCERGELSETAFLRRSKNAAKLILRYEVKKVQLTRFIG